MPEKFELFVTCAKGLEYLLEEETDSLGCQVSKVHPAGVETETDLQGIFRLCLWSRLANRVLLSLAATQVADRDGLYQAARAVCWEKFLDEGMAYWISAFGQSGSLKHSGFGAQVVNDAIKDYFRDKGLEPPFISRSEAKQTLQLNLRRTITLSLDLAGRSLHQRGYRLEGEKAPLKENLAAAILIRSGWPQLLAADCQKSVHPPLLDPMCGSGTLVIEAAMMAMDIAPGLHNPEFDFLHARWFNKEIWQEVLADAQQRAALGKRRWQGSLRGEDMNPAAVRAAKHNLARAGLDRWVEFSQGDATTVKPLAVNNESCNDEAEDTAAPKQPKGLVICNPPYGERLGQELELRALYQRFGRQLRSAFGGWRAGIFTASKFLAKELGMRAEKEYKLFNGKLPATLFLFSVYGDADKQISTRVKTSSEEEQSQQRVFSDQAQMLANRLRKNKKQLQRQVKKEALEAYRLYDADMPEYAVAIDCYADNVCIQEYAPPKSVDAEKARQRFLDVLEVVPQVLQISSGQVFVKQRKKQKGNEQYQRQQHRQKELVIDEYGSKLLVNLSDFLDTGLFLDHRPVRKYIQDHARGKRFLNLFCYTATASVHAAIGGAASTTSVDLSNTYINWAERNFRLNNLLGREPGSRQPIYGKSARPGNEKHRFERADVRQWLARNNDLYDIIFLDTPTFSNSKSMADALDIQQDHVSLIKAAMKRLAKGGVLIFSNNYRRFKLDEQGLEQFETEDRTEFSIPFDFSRKRIHQCWFIRHRHRSVK